MLDLTSLFTIILSSSVVVTIINTIANKKKNDAEAEEIRRKTLSDTIKAEDDRFYRLYERLKIDYDDKCKECDRYEKRIAEYQEQISYYTSLLIKHGIDFRRFEK